MMVLLVVLCVLFENSVRYQSENGMILKKNTAKCSFNLAWFVLLGFSLMDFFLLVFWLWRLESHCSHVRLLTFIFKPKKEEIQGDNSSEDFFLSVPVKFNQTSANILLSIDCISGFKLVDAQLYSPVICLLCLSAVSCFAGKNLSFTLRLTMTAAGSRIWISDSGWMLQTKGVASQQDLQLFSSTGSHLI